MFGYVRPSVQDLPEGELNRFRTMYCGLCHTLSRRYGQAARFILNYDFTYLAILLSDGAAGTEHSGRCYTSPIRKRPYLETTAAMELAADTFAVLLSSAAAELENRTRQRILEQILYHLGRWVYLIDAADDLKKDAESGNYNPVALRYGLENGVWTPESRREFAGTLDHSIHQMAAAFELWDFGVWTPVLQATFYAGLFQVGRAVLDGTFRRHQHRKNIKEIEETT